MGTFDAKRIFFYIVCSVLFLVVLDSARSFLLFRKSKNLVERSVPFESLRENSKQKILVLGDSTAVGTGVDDLSLSTAGRLSNVYPEAQVINRAQNGMRLKDLVVLMDDIKPEERFSVILVQIGANDIIRYTSLKSIESDVVKILDGLSKHSDNVIILHSGDVGGAPFFPRYLRPLMSKRSHQVREIYERVSDKYGVAYVDLIGSQTDSIFNQNPSKYYAEDYLHLSDEGYGVWFSEIQKKLK